MLLYFVMVDGEKIPIKQALTAIDTSFIIALLNERDVRHRGAIEALENIGGDEALVTHPLVVQESITVIARKAREQSSNCRQ